jgi:hypothetical protein
VKVGHFEKKNFQNNVIFDFGQKKTLPRLLDRDKTKNKHYEQTLSYIKK